jgi:hypothetical protein
MLALALLVTPNDVCLRELPDVIKPLDYIEHRDVSLHSKKMTSRTQAKVSTIDLGASPASMSLSNCCDLIRWRLAQST